MTPGDFVRIEIAGQATKHRVHAFTVDTEGHRMESLIAEFGHPTFTPFPVVVARLLLAALFGAAIGFEREWRARSAGEAVKVDPIRIVEAVTAGVAFLAAGVVIFTKGQVHGLTTGAGMWLAGAIGVACGLGLWQIALLATLIALVVLGLLHALESKLAFAGQAPGAADAPRPDARSVDRSDTMPPR